MERHENASQDSLKFFHSYKSSKLKLKKLAEALGMWGAWLPPRLRPSKPCERDLHGSSMERAILVAVLIVLNPVAKCAMRRYAEIDQTVKGLEDKMQHP